MMNDAFLASGKKHLVIPSVHVFVTLLTGPSQFSISRATHPPNTTEVLVTN